MPEAIVALGETKRIVGRLRFESNGRRQYSQFEYDETWLAADNAFALSPGLPLRAGGFFASGGGRDDKRNALHGCFADAAPDSWGRALMAKALDGGLTEFDYLTRSDDRTRQGALRFLGEDLEPLSDLAPPIPRLVDLERLRALSARFERDPGGADAEVCDLAGIAGSLGGARPKANVEGDGYFWIAKFTSERDKKPIERAEVATLKMAEACDLHVAEARLELSGSDHPIALIQRFDRRGATRIPYMSARTALQWDRPEGGYYSDIADVIRQISNDPLDDLRELWKRIVFTILISNSDDHLKNHGFVYVGNGRWRLSRAFDINPSPDRHRVLETGIMRGKSFDASLALALEASVLFEIESQEARKLAKEIANITTGTWKQCLRDQGTDASQLKLYTDAFEHDDAERALRLD